MLDKIPTYRRKEISQAVQRSYQDADINLDDLKPGIVPLYSLIQAYPISVYEIQDMTGNKVVDFLTEKTEKAISIPESKDCLLAGYLYIREYRGLLRSFILTEKRPSAAPIFRRRFSAAHELGHYLLHFLPLLEADRNDRSTEPLIITEGHYPQSKAKESEEPENEEEFKGQLSLTDGLQTILNNLGIDRNLMEAEADCFAAELLMPEKACYELAKRFQGRFGKKQDVLVGRLAPEFLVSKQAMKRRLEDLQIPEKLE
jgi:hypothetical protein